MNIRKSIDYSAMFASLDTLMAADRPQMELYCEIGKLISSRTEKGAAVAASEHLRSAYPDVSGFSPRNLRRMREFYRTYAADPEVLTRAMTIGWTQNVVILEAELTLQERAWYLRAAGQFGWSKLELSKKIQECAYETIVLKGSAEICDHGDDGSSERDGGNRIEEPQRQEACGMLSQNLSLPSAGVNRNFWRHSTPVNENCQASRSPPSTACAKRTFPPALCRIWRQQTILQKMHWCCDWPLLCFLHGHRHVLLL